MHEGHYVTNPVNDVERREKLAHWRVRGLELRNHFAPFHLLDELLQCPFKNDVIDLAIWHVFSC